MAGSADASGLLKMVTVVSTTGVSDKFFFVRQRRSEALLNPAVHWVSGRGLALPRRGVLGDVPRADPRHADAGPHRDPLREPQRVPERPRRAVVAGRRGARFGCELSPPHL